MLYGIKFANLKAKDMNPIRKLMGETAIYGFFTILGRLINWLLVSLYTRVVRDE